MSFCAMCKDELELGNEKEVCKSCYEISCISCERAEGKYEIKNEMYCLDCCTGMGDDLHDQMKEDA